MSTDLMSSVVGMNPTVLWGTNPLTRTGMTSHPLQGVVVDITELGVAQDGEAAIALDGGPDLPDELPVQGFGVLVAAD